MIVARQFEQIEALGRKRWLGKLREELISGQYATKPLLRVWISTPTSSSAKYTERRVRRWLMRRTGERGTGIAQIPDECLYRTLGLYNVPARLSDLSRATV